MIRPFWRDTRGQAAVEQALLYAGIVLPLTFSLVFAAEMLWVWHSAVDFTRDGVRYAATHCWQPGGENVLTYMRSHVPRMIDMDQFQGGQAEIAVEYFSRDPDTGGLVEFSCENGECSVQCVPDTVTIRITNYQFRRFVNFLGLPPVTIPEFQVSAPVESGGCDPDSGSCLP
jgi:Flp pilus assembly pilin Flp